MDHHAQLFILVAIIGALAGLLFVELMGGGRRRKRKRSVSNSDMLSLSAATDSADPLYSMVDSLLDSSGTLDAVLAGIGTALADLRAETRVMAVEYEPLAECPHYDQKGRTTYNEIRSKNSATESCARWSWMSAGGLNRTLLPPIEAFGQECF